jgi:hypothetical protein
MTQLALFCKSYSTDLNRAHRLLTSIERFNSESLPVFISAPTEEVKLFKDHLKNLNVIILTDEEIISCNKKINKTDFSNLPGNISQQIVKSEFWRLNLCENYICLDSDAYFIKNFKKSDFISPDGVPYTVIDQCQDLLLSALKSNKHRVINDYRSSAKAVAEKFGRSGPDYSYGPMPIWSTKVWESLDKNYISPRNKSFLDLILEQPHELRWYGEALLAYHAIPIIPIQPQFRTYHYYWQLKDDKNRKITEEKLKNIFLGIVHQSAWERELDWPFENGTLPSRISRRLKKLTGKI